MALDFESTRSNGGKSLMPLYTHDMEEEDPNFESIRSDDGKTWGWVPRKGPQSISELKKLMDEKINGLEERLSKLEGSK